MNNVNNENKKSKTLVTLIFNVFLFIFMIVCAVIIMFTIASKKGEDGAVTVFGYQLRTVLTGSMEESEYTNVSDFDVKSIPVDSLVLIKVAPETTSQRNQWYEEEVEVGDVLTFKYTKYGIKQVTITHRVIDKQPVEGGYLISLEGDNKTDTSNPGVQVIDTTKSSTSGDYIIGEVVAYSLIAGKITNFVKSPAGIILLIMVPCFFIIIYEVMKILKIAKDDKKEIAVKVAADKDGEIEELRRELEALRSKAVQNASAAEDSASEETEVEAQTVESVEETKNDDAAEPTETPENSENSEN